MENDRNQFGGVLSESELRVLQKAAAGYKNKEIAKSENYSPDWIDKLLSRSAECGGLYYKIGVKNRAEAVRWYSDTLALDKGKAHIAQDIEFINKVRLRGDPKSAIEMCDKTLELIEQNLTTFDYQNVSRASYRRDFEEMRARVEYQKSVAFAESSLPSAIQPVMHGIASSIMSIAQAYKSLELMGLAHYVAGDGHYILGRYQQSIIDLSMGFESAKDCSFKLSFLRTSALNLACLGDAVGFVAKANQMTDLIEAGHCSDLTVVCAAYEGIARGRNQLDLPNAIDAVRSGEKVYSQICATDRAPLRSVQLTRTATEIYCKAEPRNHALIEQSAQDCIQLASKFGYPRYVSQVEKLLQRYLN